MASLWVGYELGGSEAALHTVVTPTTKTEGAGLNSGSAAEANDASWIVGAGAGGGGNNWLKYDFGSPQAITAIKLRAMVGVTVEGSDDDSGWDNITPLNTVGVAGSATQSEYVLDFDGTQTYRYFRFTMVNWRLIANIEFYSEYNPGEIRVWGPNPLTTNYAFNLLEGEAGNYASDGSSGHMAGWMFDSAAIIDEFTFTSVTAQTVALWYSDNGYDWTISDASMVLLADTPYVITPASNTGHAFWKIPFGTWKTFAEVAYTLAAPPPPPEPEAPAEVSGGHTPNPRLARVSPNAQSWRLALDQRRKWGRSQYWK